MCKTRGSPTLEWRGDSFYVGSQIGFVAEIHPINFTRTSISNYNTVATLTKNFRDGDVRVLVSTLRITALSDAPSGFVMCAHANGTEVRIEFQVLGEFDRVIIITVHLV